MEWSSSLFTDRYCLALDTRIWDPQQQSVTEQRQGLIGAHKMLYVFYFSCYVKMIIGHPGGAFLRHPTPSFSTWKIFRCEDSWVWTEKCEVATVESGRNRFFYLDGIHALCTIDIWIQHQPAYSMVTVKKLEIMMLTICYFVSLVFCRCS